MVSKKRKKWVDPTASILPWRVAINCLMVLLTLVFLIPFALIAVASFTPETEITAKGFQLFPSSLTLYNYRYLFGQGDKFLQAMKVTVTLTVVGTFNTLFFTSMGAYVLSRRYLPGRKVLTFYVFLTMLLNGGLIPWYMVVRGLGLVDTFAALFIPQTIAAWHLIVMRNSFMALPPSLEESAKIDGANDLTVFFRIILPISKPIIATMTVYLAVNFWNEWYSAMLFITRRTELVTLQYLLREVLQQSASLNSRGGIDIRAMSNQAIPSESLKMAVVMIATVPIICVYPFLQRFFIHGVMIGSIKE